MCGRYTLFSSDEEIREHFDLPDVFEWEPRYNIAPGEDIPAVGLSDDGESYGISQFRWGLVPHWADSPEDFTANLINARSETVASKPAFRDSFRKRRCLIPSSGFYEWAETSDVKQPYFIGPEEDGIVAFAGIWDRWESPDDDRDLLSCSILTTEAREPVKDIHHRMPVIIGEDQYERWLSPDDPSTMLEAMVDEAPVDQLTAYPVDPAVNNAGYDAPDCVEPAQ